jgi:hypothetical protein
LKKAQQGKVNGAERQTYGYKYHHIARLPGGKIQDGYMEVDPFESDVVKRLIFEDYAEHGSAFRIQMALNRAGILTRYGNPWANFTVLKVLRNPMYIGEYVTTVKGEDFKPETHPLKVPAIIDRALWEKVQVKLSQSTQRAGRPSKHNLLTGFIHCLCTLPTGIPCKRRWTMHRKGRWYCSNTYDNRTRQKLCIARPIHAALMDTLVLDGVRDRLRNPDLAYRLAKEYHAETTRSDNPQGKSLESRRASLKARYKRAEDILFSDLPQATRDRAAGELRAIEQERMALEVEARESAAVALAPQDRITDTCRQMRKGLDGLKTFEEKREFIERTVDRIETDGVVYTVFCRVELAPANASSGAGGNGQLTHGQVDHFAFVIRGRLAA